MADPYRPRVFSTAGREWDLLDEVFAPAYSPSTATALEFLGLTDPDPGAAPTCTSAPTWTRGTAPTAGIWNRQCTI